MRTPNVRRPVLSALMAALTCLSTMIVLQYSPAGGYVHLGDCLVLLCGFILGPLWGGLAAGVGSALTDMLLSSPQYIPATFVIKWGVAALAVTLSRGLHRAVHRARRTLPLMTAAAVAGELLMVAGYFAYETVLYGVGGALSGVIGNLIQGGFAVVLATVLLLPLARVRYFEVLMDEWQG